MTDTKELQQYRSEIESCVLCGSCQAHCPVYNQTRHEGSVARGKLSIAKALLKGDIEIEKRLEEEMSLCLLCGSCVLKCPNKVPTDKIVAAMRRVITGDKGLSATGKAISTITGSPPLMKTVLQSIERVKPAVFKSIPDSSGMRLRFPLSKLQQRIFPTIAPQSLFDLYPEVIPGKKNKPVVGLFAGCSITYFYPQIGTAMITLLQRLGYTIILPKTQTCCGLPARSAGDGKRIEQLGRTNIDAFATAGVDYIITGCASCHSGLLESACTETFPDFTSKVIDIHVFCQQQGILDRFKTLPEKAPPILVTYHDPCHLRTKKITREPRLLLQSLPGVEYREMKDAGLCCGLGGTFSAYHYDISQAIGQKKMKSLSKTQADYIATGCPGCMIQLQDAIYHAGLKVKVVHTFDLVDRLLTRIADDLLSP